MTILEQIKQDLVHLDEQQLQQVAELITTFKLSKKTKQRLSDFYGALPATSPYPGKEAIRQSITTYLAQKHNLTES
jgi:hypothetical protein